MKKAIKKIADTIILCFKVIIVMGFCLYILCTVLLLVVSWITNYFEHCNFKADDAISRAVYEAVGAKELRYRGQSDNTAGTTTYYTYHINKEKEGTAEEAVEAINEVMEQKVTSHKISISFYKEFVRGAYEPLFIVCNYTDGYSSSANYEKVQYLCILGTHHGFEESIYNDPETYKNFPDIQYLKVSEKIQKAADEAGIDWYEYWPDLKTVEVYSPMK